MVMQLRHGGVWKEPKVLRCRHSGEWRTVDQGWVLKDGVWQKWYGRTPPSAPPPPPPIEYARLIPGRIDAGRVTVSGDRLTVESNTAALPASVMGDVLFRSGKRWAEFVTDATMLNAGNVYLGMSLDWYQGFKTVFPSAYGHYIRINAANINVYNGSTLLGQTSTGSFAAGDTIGFGFDFTTSTIVVHVNGVQVFSQVTTLPLYTSFGDIGWRRLFIGVSSSTAASRITMHASADTWVHGPPDETWEGWTAAWTNVQRVAGPSTWLQGGSSPSAIYAQAADNNDFDALKTVEFLARFTTVPFAYDGLTSKYIISKLNGTTTYGLGFNQVGVSAGNGTNHIIALRVQSNLNTGGIVRCMKPYDGFWHRVSIVAAFSAAKVRLYHDGVLLGEDDITGTSMLNNARALVLLSQSGGLTTGNITDVEIADVRLWDTERSPAEIAANLDDKAVSGSAAGLRGLWHCDEGAGTTLDDETSLNHDMTASDAAIWESA